MEIVSENTNLVKWHETLDFLRGDVKRSQIPWPDFKAHIELQRQLHGPMPRSLKPLFFEIIDNNWTYLSDKRAAIQAVFEADQPLPEQSSLSPEIEQKLAQKEIWLIRVDPEVMRILIGLHLTTAARLYALALDMMRNDHEATGGNCWIDIQALYAAQHEAGITLQRSTFYEALRAGIGLLWRGRHNGRLYILAQKKTAGLLVERAIAAGLPGLVATNKPGSKAAYINPGGSLQQFEIACYEAWLGMRRYPSLGRETLQALWNREKKALLEWERESDNIRVQENYAQTASPHDPRIPDHAAPADLNGHNGYIWRRPNTYHLIDKPMIHRANGQRKKVRGAALRKCEDHDLLLKPGGNGADVRNFVKPLPVDFAELTPGQQWYEENNAIYEAEKAFIRATTKRPEAQTLRYLYIGRRGDNQYRTPHDGIGTWELMLPVGASGYSDRPKTSPRHYRRVN